MECCFCQINVSDRHGNTALHRAARYPPILQTLLSHQANASSTNHAGDTALHIAAEEGKEESCVLLLQAGLRGDVKNKEGKSAADLGGKALEHLWKK
jgi:ankyrin repeat protein